MHRFIDVRFNPAGHSDDSSQERHAGAACLERALAQLAQHRSKLSGGTGQQQHEAIVMIDPQPGGAPFRIRYHAPAKRDHRLPPVAFRHWHRQVAARKASAQMGGDRLVFSKGAIQDGRNGLPRQIVVGRSKPATENNEICTSKKRSEDMLELCSLVTDDGLRLHVDAQDVELFSDEERVRIDLCRRQQLAADSNDGGRDDGPWPRRRCHESHPAGAMATSKRMIRLPYIAAIASSAITPRPPCSASKRLAGHGLITSRRRNSRKPAMAPGRLTGMSANVINIPTTSSRITGAGSTPPKYFSAAFPLHTPIASRMAMTASSRPGEPDHRTAANTTRPAAEPNVPGAIGT